MPSERLLFLTGKLAKPRLEKVLSGIDFGGRAWRIADIGVKVAALMTEALIRRRLPAPVEADRVILPGRVRVDLDVLSAHYGAAFERGPEELNDLPGYFGKHGTPPDLSRHDMRIFAEIVDASRMSVAAVLARAALLRNGGADVIDIGCLPDTPFPHLEETVAALKAEGFAVSVDSADADELRRGAKAGADFLLSLTEHTLDLAADTAAVPILIPAGHGDMASLYRACDAMEARGLPYIADPVLDPIHFGFTASLLRYAEFRRERPDAEILMGTGNLTELTDADSGGVTAVLLGIASELHIRNLLTVQVSPHTRRTVEEHDSARRMMFAAREDGALPRDYSAGLLSLHERRPFPNSPAEIAETAAQLRDRNYRIEVAEDGIHVFAREVHLVEREAFAFFPQLGVENDAGHAFYLGAELARAEIAWQLGKRYAQDSGLRWGVATDVEPEDLARLKEAGTTLSHAIRTGSGAGDATTSAKTEPQDENEG
jgi:dihydropteroate synthase